MNKERIRHYSHVISAHADSAYATLLFSSTFFLDALIVVLPIDSIMSATLTLKPQHARKWVLSAMLGFSLGLGLVALMANSHLEPYLLSWIAKLGYSARLEEVLSHAQTHGYWELTLGSFTILPPIFGVLMGVSVGLNPWAVLFICVAGKMTKLVLMVWLAISSSPKIKKFLQVYLKTSV